MTQKEMAEKFNVSVSTVKIILLCLARSMSKKQKKEEPEHIN